jgi:DNA polymerase-3 subunit delta'
VHWVRAESKSRVIVIGQMRELMQEINLKPTEAEYKVAVIVAADRLKMEAANAFLKTLEEPPPKSVLILLTTEPQRILETILSRCLRLNFAGEGGRKLDAGQTAWLTELSENAAVEQKGLLGRYRLLGVLLKKLAELKVEIERSLTARSPLERYPDVEPALREKWEEELAAAIEAEYRRQRTDLLLELQWWLRDVWLRTLALKPELRGHRTRVGSAESQSMRVQELLNFPGMAGAQRVAQRILPNQALENLQTLEQTQRLLGTNVQEALVLEVGLLKLKL